VGQETLLMFVTLYLTKEDLNANPVAKHFQNLRSVNSGEGDIFIFLPSGLNHLSQLQIY